MNLEYFNFEIHLIETIYFYFNWNFENFFVVTVSTRCKHPLYHKDCTIDSNLSARVQLPVPYQSRLRGFFDLNALVEALPKRKHTQRVPAWIVT